jgi:formate hydrogenlyase subunit 3/multisubunit Na+/H+ antiporter MnhD subunit
MRILGYLFIACGLVLCFTILFFTWGLGAIAAGALLCIAARDEQPSRIGRIIKYAVLGVVGLVVVWAGLVWYWVASGTGHLRKPGAAAVQAAQPAPHKAKRHATAPASRVH